MCIFAFVELCQCRLMVLSFYRVINRQRKQLKGPERKETDVNLPLFCWQNLSGNDVGQTICCIHVVGSLSVHSLPCTSVRTEASEG